MEDRRVRDPIHGFIHFNSWEKQIIDSEVFQRLRRIKQLAWTDMVYPGASHNRFEHSLGVMQVTTRAFDLIVNDNKEYLKSALQFSDGGLDRDRTVLRLASLLHDVGHPPFSHAGEGVMPFMDKDKRYKHEHYSAAIIRHLMQNVIEDHPFNVSVK